MTAHLYVGDCRTVLPTLPAQSVRCCVTSPPYFGLRDYGHESQIGLEATPDAYVAELVSVFREVRRVLTDDGTLWLNLGGSYSSGCRTTQVTQTVRRSQVVDSKRGPTARTADNDPASCKHAHLNGTAMRPPVIEGLGGKNLLGIPWRVAFALQADGWYLRSDIIWHKPNPMPESVTDRPTKAHEYVFLLSKSARYYYDAAAIAEPAIHAGRVVEYDGTQKNSTAVADPKMRTRLAKTTEVHETRNVRSVWSITTKPYAGAHFATMPPELAERCILAASAPGDTVLDPFGGSGTTAMVATGHGRGAIHIDASEDYTALAVKRIGPMLCAVVR